MYKTRILTVLAATLLALTTKVSAQDFEYNGINYTVTSAEDKTCKTSDGINWEAGANNPVGDVVLPETVVYNGDTYTVTEIGICSFFEAESMTAITIPPTVTKIDRAAFMRCTALTGIVIPNTVTEIGTHTLAGCSTLTDVTLPDNLQTIPYEMFLDCVALTEFNFPPSVTAIDDYAFYHCIGMY
ncbi:MAG: leucine-rich repeat domain-containing protein [Muribaculaceae bacterium]|nr:leucine-rich repeat domain-containing protein [Muribaculaceae bacterium]